ncbi:hypothetical protein E1265_07795 [Streptomyces sp. 8K308]|uniref:endo alpha-1,4 polygalactosaminidase n=1 Tax=Streptomyces sp. 8K308 TaxID=2530388 RepID=UPI0010459F5A|nr:endo alpha-1,4 polygalactosaminidase [Streptomyces sp. 8K308]TDC25166.1 hypothetical protein E1265_07795 [Streptomyces sp. 8K308]
MRRVRGLLGAVVLVGATLVACGEEASEPEWWRPAPGEVASWDWQISEPYDLSAPHDMYDLDLFDLAPAGSELWYPDGDVIEVPAGPLAGAIEELHAREPRPVVICYVDTGAHESYRPDAERFPEAVIGNDTGWSEERWLDIRAGSRGAFAELVWARLDLAERMGCDGVEPDQNNPLGNDPGFPITLDDQHSWYREVAEQAHARGLSVGMKNGHDQPGSAAELVDAFDWALPEECVEFDECAELDVFVEQGKAVFAVDYPPAVDPAAACREHRAHGFDGLVKDEPPTGGYRVSCGG